MAWYWWALIGGAGFSVAVVVFLLIWLNWLANHWETG